MSIEVLTSGISKPGASIFVTGLSETDTVTASNGVKTLTGKWTQKPNPTYVVPDGYTQLEYIKATGSQFINTGIAPSSGISVELGIIPDTSAMSGNAIFGSTWDTSGFFLMFYQNNIRFHSKGAVVDISSFNTTSENKIVCTQSGISVNGTNYSLSGTGTDSSDNIVLWSVSNESDYSDKRGKDSKTYCRIKVGDSVVREYIPCKRNSDGAIGMYDLVSNMFFGNNGIGEFIAGPEAPQTIDCFLIKPIRDLGTWTVTATNGEKTTTQDVLVDVITEYVVEMSYNLWLYRYGNECEDVTGGWKLESKFTTMTKEVDAIKISYSTQQSYGAFSESFVNNKLDLTDYSTVHLIGTIVPSGSTSGMQFYSVVDNTSIGMGFSTEAEHEFTCDISSYSGNKTFAIKTDSHGNVGNTVFYIYKVWLE